MAASDGVVLFQRGTGNDEDEYDSDDWDDTALIQAYDAAVAPLKAKLAEHTGDSTILDNASNKTKHSGQPKKKKNKKKKVKQMRKKKEVDGWAVGDFCQAVYTEDGAVYEAKIVSIGSDDNTCVVRYLGYGNEEQQNLDDLIRHDRSSAHRQHRNDSVSFSETESVTSWQSSPSHRGGKKGRSSAGPWTWPSFPSFSQGSSLPPPPPFPPHFPGMPSQAAFSMPHPSMGSAASMPFPMMPPPPPPMPHDNVTDENEALCSMLLSWYMSGYHTGYYQGLRQGRQQDVSAAMGPSR